MFFENWMKMKWKIYFCDRCKNKRFLDFDEYRRHIVLHELE